MNVGPQGTSPIEPLSVLVDETLTVAHLRSEPLWTISPRELASDAAAALRARDFDIAGVEGQPVTKFVRCDELVDAGRRRVEHFARPIPASMCVEKSLPLSTLFQELEHREFVFVLDNADIGYVITRADLQAPAIGVVVLAYLTVLESGLRRLVAKEVGDSLLDGLSDARRTIVEALYAKKRRQNVATGYEDCLYFGDWLHLAQNPAVRERLGYDSKSTFRKATSSFDIVRNALAHGGTILDGDQGPVRALQRVARIRSFTERVWSEVDQLDGMWEVYAATRISKPRGGATLAGDGAANDLGVSTPAHVITAWNPGSIQRSRTANRAANTELRELLVRHGGSPRMVIGESPDGRWREESYLVTGLTRVRAAEIAGLFGQRGIFELDERVLRVVRSSDASEMVEVPRVR